MQNVDNLLYIYINKNQKQTNENKQRNSYLAYIIPTSLLLKNKALKS